MKIGPKFKIARRLGSPIFEKTQNSKFKTNQERKSKSKRGRMGGVSEYGRALLEKQKARFSYGVSEKQFGNYVKKILEKKSPVEPTKRLFQSLERRLDNVVYRLGLAKTRLGARQMVSHGHICVNGRKVTIPSLNVYVGDKITIRAGSQSKPLFATLEERVGEIELPSWLKFDFKSKEGVIEALPEPSADTLLFDLAAVLEFYKR